MTSDAKTAAIVGVGPGLGRAVAARFAQGGCAVALMARSEEASRSVQGEITSGGGVARSFACDASDEGSVRSAFARVREELGDPEVLVYNAGAFQMGGVLQLSPADL
jgi:NAD(P)-dependent dehydrogenase (short-subunit alcohol dehydrogenase family)